MSLHTLALLADQQFSPVLHRVATPPSPAAGAEFSVTVPGDQVWHVHALRVGLITSAVVANRVPFLFIDDGVTVIAQLVAGNVVVASQNQSLAWLENYPTITGGQGIEPVAPLLSPCYLLPGWRLRSHTFAMDVADQYGPLAVLVDSMFVGEAGINQIRLLYSHLFAEGMLDFVASE